MSEILLQRLYCLPKTHKPDVPLCFIISPKHSPTYSLKHWAGLLKLFIGGTGYFNKQEIVYCPWLRILYREDTKYICRITQYLSFSLVSLFAMVLMRKVWKHIQELFQPILECCFVICSLYHTYSGTVCFLNKQMGSPKLLSLVFTNF